MQLINMLRDPFHLAAGLVNRYARFEPRVRVYSRMIAAIFLSSKLIFQPPKRCENIRLPETAMKLGGEHSNDRVGLSVQIELLSNDIWIAAEAALPESFPAQHNPGGADLIVIGSEFAAQNGLDSQGREESRGDAAESQSLWFTFARQNDIIVLIGNHALKDFVLRAPVIEVRHRDAHLGYLFRPFPEKNKPARFRIRQWAEQHRVDNAEDGGVGANA